MFASESINNEREKANLLCLIKLTLNTLIDQSSSPTALPVLDDRNNDVTNFILTLERVLNFRMRANWLSERRCFWDFIRPACIGSSRQTIIERVEEVSKTKSMKYRGRTWIKFALMEKKLSELLKLVLSDCQLVRKFYHEDSIMTSSQAFILCDQLAGLSAIDFSFCFKQDDSLITPLLFNGSEIDVIDLTPYLYYNSKNVNNMKQLLKDQNNDEENKQPIPTLAAVNELKPLHLSEREMVPLDKHKLEVEQRKYFEELLRHRDRELQQLKARFETLKSERENEVVLMENIILELQLELRAARDEAEFKRKKSQQTGSITPSKSLFNFANRKTNSPTTPTNDQNQDDDTQMRPIDAMLITDRNETSNLIMENVNQIKNSNDIISQSSRRSSQSTTTNTDDDQYEVVNQLSSNNNQISTEIKPTSSPEMVSSATSLSTPPSSPSSSSSSDDEETPQKQTVLNIENSNPPIIQESGRFEPVEITAEQATLLEEASKTD
ncbi:unnamed protein product [Rotaria sordida]|uniref:RUN domain-containing protein n=1 Tax=Rotaria sordida TaxID=392033 RepID=A0A815KAD7_9BILA|nr:unnamed protein product [Rotaria sordida]CAF1393044.1 unnamed protein product [Rotaria sordida]